MHDVVEILSDWAMVLGFFAVQAFVAGGGLNALVS